MAILGGDVLTLGELTPQELSLIIERAKVHARLSHQAANRPRPLADRSIAIVMLKPSLRTRVSFEVAVRQLGGYPVILGPDTYLSRGESVHDTIKTLERYCEMIVIRAFEHSHVEEVAAIASVPVINALTDDYHPCQVLADLLTIDERFGRLTGLDIAYVGDGNNIANTLLIGAALAGTNIACACPAGYEPSGEATERARQIASQTGASIVIGSNPREAVTGADVVITDTWVSMGQEAEREQRMAAFQGYTVSEPLMALAKPSAIFMHCLPAHRGEEVSPEVIDGPQSVVFEEAGNRMRAEKALMHVITVG